MMQKQETPRWFRPFVGWWNRLPEHIRLNLENNFLPKNPADKLLPGEVVQLTIGLAWYRDIAGRIIFRYLGTILLLTGVASGVLWLLSRRDAGINPGWVALPPILLLLLAGYGAYKHIEHLQWRLVKTNARVVVSIPVYNNWPLVDNIELKGLPTVIDTNWSKNPLWRIFQTLTGARDLYISLIPVQFEERSATVRGALVIPDVMPEDVWKLKQEVFKPFSPQPVRFLSPQEVKIVEPDGE